MSGFLAIGTVSNLDFFADWHALKSPAVMVRNYAVIIHYFACLGTVNKDVFFHFFYKGPFTEFLGGCIAGTFHIFG